MVFDLCLKWTRNASDAEDLTQDTMVKAHARLGQLRDPAQFPAWLVRIAVNLCKNWLARSRHDTLPLEAAEREAGQSQRPHEGLEEVRAVHEALSGLPADLRLAVRLFYLNGMTQKELAALWNLPESTVKSRLDIGRRMMRKELTRMGLMPGTETREEVGVPNPSVLLASTDHKAARELRTGLKAEGYDCSVITDAEQLLPRLRRLLPILIVDIPFGETDEFEMHRKIKLDSRLRGVPVLFLAPVPDAKEAHDAHVRNAWQSGVDCYLTKPYDPVEVRSFVRRLANGVRSAAYQSLAIDHAWRRDTPQVLHCLERAVELGGKMAADSVKSDTAFNYIRHTNEFKALVGDLPGCAD